MTFVDNVEFFENSFLVAMLKSNIKNYSMFVDASGVTNYIIKVGNIEY